MSKRFYLLMLAFIIPFAASSKEASLVQEVQKRTKALNDYQIQRRQVLDSLYQIQKKIKSLAKTQAQIMSNSQRLNVEMEKSAASLLEMEENLVTLRQRVGKSALLLSHVDASSMMKILFAAKSPAELDRTIKFFELIVRRELKVLKVFQTQAQEIQKKQEDIKIALAEIQKSEREMASTEAELKAEHKRKQALISKLDSRRQSEIESLRALKLKSLGQIALELDRDEVLEEFLRPSFLEQKGSLTPPLRGEVLGRYGLIIDPVLQTQTSMGGWFITAKDGLDVRVPFSGKVAIVHRDAKLKYVVIIDHGHDYYTSYSNLDELTVGVGEELEVGHVVGQAGYSSRWRTEGVHFEIRHFSEALDPVRWVMMEKSVRKQASLIE